MKRRKRTWGDTCLTLFKCSWIIETILSITNETPMAVGVFTGEEEVVEIEEERGEEGVVEEVEEERSSALLSKTCLLPTANKFTSKE